MNIELQEVGKRYRREWIFRGLDLSLEEGARCALQGSNGSGKSTLLRIISGQLGPTEGAVNWTLEGNPVAAENIYEHLAWGAPYISPDSEMSFSEIVRMQEGFKPWITGINSEEVIRRSGLEKHQSKAFSTFSSGMKQRVRLALAFYMQSSILLLDEPTTNLDEQAFEWYEAQLEETAGKRIIIIASNMPREYRTCTAKIDMNSFRALRN